MKRIFITAIMLSATVYFTPRTKAQERRSQIQNCAQYEAGFYRQPIASFMYDQSAATKTQCATNQSPHWYESPEWILVIVGIITCVFIAWQSLATARAAKASAASVQAEKKSIELQEAAFAQWLQIEEWTTEVRDDPEGSKVLKIKFEILNATKFPLMIRQVSIKIPMHESWSIFDKHRLAPNEKHSYDITHKLTSDALRSWNGPGLVLIIVGFVEFEGILKKTEQWPLTGILTCRPAHAVFQPEHIGQDKRGSG